MGIGGKGELWGVGFASKIKRVFLGSLDVIPDGMEAIGKTPWQDILIQKGWFLRRAFWLSSRFRAPDFDG